MGERLKLGEGNARISFEKIKNFMVIDYFDNLENTPEKFQQNRGYIKDDMVYIYLEHPSSTMEFPWFTWDEKKEQYKFSERNIYNKDKFDKFTVDHVRDISMEKINEDLQEHEDLYDEEEVRFMNAAGKTWEPIFKADDDFLKKGVKNTIKELGVNVNSFINKFPKKYQVVNMKSALNGDTKTSTKMFDIWMELMKTEFILVIKSQRSAPIKLDGYVVYRSKEDKAYYTHELTKKDLE